MPKFGNDPSCQKERRSVRRLNQAECQSEFVVVGDVVAQVV
jgi:hypothetical protein